YNRKHVSISKKVLHFIDSLMMSELIILRLFMPGIWGVRLVFGGWVLLFLGHRMEGNHPVFFQGPIYLLVGPIWVAREVWMFLLGTNRRPTSDGTTRSTATK